MSDTSLQTLAQTAPVRRVVSHAARVRNLDPTRPITDVIQAVSGYLATRQQCQTEQVRIDAIEHPAHPRQKRAGILHLSIALKKRLHEVTDYAYNTEDEAKEDSRHLA